jgi:hypothetical protein
METQKPVNGTDVVPRTKPKRVPAFKIPKQLAVAGDLLYETRQKRLALQKEVDELQSQETQLKDYLIANLPKSQASGIAGKVARIKIETKDIPQVKDWDVFYKYVKRTGDFDLMQRRLSDTAVKARWENGKQVPGVEVFTSTVVSCTKV